MFTGSGFQPSGADLSGNPFQAAMQAYFNGMQGSTTAIEPMMKSIARCQFEMMGFWSRRAQAYLEIPSRLSRCRTPNDLLSEQLRFWQTASHQYNECAHRIMAAASSAAMPAAFQQPERRAAPRSRDYLDVGGRPQPAAAEGGTKVVPAGVPRRVA